VLTADRGMRPAAPHSSSRKPLYLHAPPLPQYNATFPAFAKLCDGGFGAQPTQPGQAVVVVSEWTRAADIGQPWQSHLKAAARRLVDEAEWAPLYAARMVRTSKGRAFGCLPGGWGVGGGGLPAARGGWGRGGGGAGRGARGAGRGMRGAGRGARGAGRGARGAGRGAPRCQGQGQGGAGPMAGGEAALEAVRWAGAGELLCTPPTPYSCRGTTLAWMDRAQGVLKMPPLPPCVCAPFPPCHLQEESSSIKDEPLWEWPGPAEPPRKQVVELLNADAQRRREREPGGGARRGLWW
jgi:hypothetical protein